MLMHGIVRVDITTATKREVCTGSSPITRKPYWAELGTDATAQPLLFRDQSYAKWCAEIAEREDTQAGVTGYTYLVIDVEIRGL